ncbi:MAG: transcriptional regulator [Candidatus Eremiobacteraeota bacterium]|nr:transcriptional regulator [Candidatus Eremiobacteraeota bacterium]MBV8366573.1 transcriptional regulator [Candidatus Eremiobacteraeota bacterium]
MNSTNARKANKKPARTNGREAPYAYEGLQRIFHERGRLAVCTCLVAHPEGMSFTDLQDACALTDGNLSRHLTALAEMGVVATTRETGHGRPTTICRITNTGRTRFLAYIDELESVVREVQEKAQTQSGDSRSSARLATT